MRAVSLLNWFKVKNALRTTFSDPRKFIPLLLFAAGMIGLIWLFEMGLHQKPANDLGQRYLDPEQLRGATTFCLIMLCISVLDSGMGDALLTFPMPDVDYLFPSPTSRRIVLAYRLPGLTLGSFFFAGLVLFVFSIVTKFAHSSVLGGAEYIAPGWVAPAALICCVGTYFNLSLAVSVRMPNRTAIHRSLIAGFLGLGAAIGLIWWSRGSDTAAAILNSNWIRWPFLPSSLASDVLVGEFSHQSAMNSAYGLMGTYLISLIPVFSSNANWYEQSIASSERTFTLRQAAREGMSSLLAAKSANFKHRAARIYTVTPFGTGSMALFWAHMCAAWKKPYANFLSPFAGGFALGWLGATVNRQSKGMEGIGFAFLIGLGSYASMAFLQIARTATEGAIRRRELIAPLPIRGWKAVTANLGVPMIAYAMFCAGIVTTYVVMRGPSALEIAFGFGIFMPLRMMSRMALQYIVILGYPDLADKMQQVFSVGVYMVVSTPLLAAEILFCIPAFLYQSVWIALFTLACLQLPFLLFTFWLAGRASEKAIASGEPINVYRTIFRFR